jgi:glycosyltransferase involved in cell wall biosynthesis
MLGRRLGKPVVITARGTDINVIPDYRFPRRLILGAAREASGLITVSHALKEKLVVLGVPAARIEALRNGVDLGLFRPVDRGIERAALGLRRPTLLSVGNLVPLKGHDLVIEALRLLEGCDLVIVGEGPQRPALVALADRLGVTDRVRFAGAIPQQELRRYYGAADALVLASSREGWANVLLEAMACGTPVVATDVGGNREVVAALEAGIVVLERTPREIAHAVQSLLARPPARDATRRYAEGFSWEATTAGQLRLFEAVAAGRAPASRAPNADSSDNNSRMASGARG